MLRLCSIACLPLVLCGINFCGLNTNVLAIPVPIVYPPASAPSILNLSVFSDAEGRESFRLQYFVTNQESDFLGYNLYISRVPTSLESLLAGSPNRGNNRYLSRGISPDFLHANDPIDTSSPITQLIYYRKAPPVPEPFYSCRLYFFKIRAYLRGGFESFPSSEVSQCFSSDPSTCPDDSPCVNL